MKLSRLCVLAAVFVLALMSYNVAFADMEECSSKEVEAMKKAVSKSKELEAKGDFVGAYDAAENRPFCDAGKIGDEAYTLEGRLRPKAAAKLEVKDPKKACELYRDSEAKYDSDADRLILKHAETAAFDVPNSFVLCELTENSAIKSKLLPIALKNADKTLEKEKAAFAKKDIKASQELLKTADRWYSLYWIEDKAGVAKVHGLAVKRGDEASTRDDIASLEAAIEYYDLFERHKDKMDAVRKKAEKIGDEYKGKNDYERAIEYYEVGLAHAKRKEVEKIIDDGRKAKEKASEEKETKRKKDFKKESDKLEKELGI